MKRKGIDAYLIFSGARRAIAATPILFGLTTAISIVLANVPTSRSERQLIRDRTVNEGSSMQVALLRDKGRASLPPSSADLFKIKVISNHEPNSIFFLAGCVGKVVRLSIGKRAWGIVCQVDDSGYASVEIIELETLLDTNQQIISKRFVDVGQSIFGELTSGMSSAPFRVELVGIQKHATTMLASPIHIGNEEVLRAAYMPASFRNRCNVAYVRQIDQGPECCVICSGIRVCGCAVEAPCGSCCVGSCCSGFTGNDPGEKRYLNVDVGESKKVDDYELTIKLVQLEPTIVLEVASPAIPKAKQLNYLDKTSMDLVIGDSRFEIRVVESRKSWARFSVKKGS